MNIIIRNEFKHYTECSICAFRKWCRNEGTTFICTACAIDPDNGRKWRNRFKR